jgi:hypothetical protein
MTRTLLSVHTWIAVVAVTVAMAVVRIEEGRVARARRSVSDLALQAANARAEGDSTRRVGVLSARVARQLRDSLRLVERLVVQRAQRQDELDGALKRERLGRYAVTVRAESLAAIASEVGQAPKADSTSSVRRASFRIRQAPYMVAADVVLPEWPDTGRMSMRVALDPLRVEARVGCAPADARGIREATVSATGPAWADIRFDRVEQSPELCASPALEAERRRDSWLPLVVGTGPVLDLHGRVSWGVFVGLGYAARR